MHFLHVPLTIKELINPDMDCDLSLCADRHNQKTPAYRYESLHNVANSERYTVLKNSINSSVCRFRLRLFGKQEKSTF